MPVHEQFKPYLDVFAQGPGLETMTPKQARAMFREMMVPLASEAIIAQKYDMKIPGPGGEIPIRIYSPVGTAPFPVLVFFHGGGFVIGDLDTADAMCQELCAGANALVVSIRDACDWLRNAFKGH